MPTLAELLDANALKAVHVQTVAWPSEADVWRVYVGSRPADAFNPSAVANARFSPLRPPPGVGALPVLYGAARLQTAFMEVLLRDAPLPSHGYILSIDRSREVRRVARLRVAAKSSKPLLLADFTALGLRALGLSRAQVVESGPGDYASTQRLAQWLLKARPEIDGIRWMSRQDDQGMAVVFFERTAGRIKLSSEEENSPFTSGPHLETLLDTLKQIGASVRLH